MHPAAYDYVHASVQRYKLRYLPMLEIGSRLINGTIRDLFTTSYGIDILPGAYVDKVACGSTFTPEVAPDVIVCCEVFEHTTLAEAICHNVFRILKPGGYFIVTAAGLARAPHSAFNGGGLRDNEFYRNVSATDLASWLSEFHILEIEVRGEDIRAVARKEPLDA